MMVPPSNITPTGLAHYTEADFRTLLREGHRPAGTMVDTLMPYKYPRLMTDAEILRRTPDPPRAFQLAVS